MIGNERPCLEIATDYCVLKTDVLLVDGKAHPLVGVHRCLCKQHKDKDQDFVSIGELSSGALTMCQWGRDLRGKVA